MFLRFQLSIALIQVMAQNRQQAITRTNDDQGLWRLVASVGHKELRQFHIKIHISLQVFYNMASSDYSS